VLERVDLFSQRNQRRLVLLASASKAYSRSSRCRMLHLGQLHRKLVVLTLELLDLLLLSDARNKVAT